MLETAERILSAGSGAAYPWLRQIALALVYYVGLLLLMRLAGKRLAGQVTTFDLLVLITLGVVLQTSVLMPGPGNAVAFIVTVFLAHRGLALICARSRRIRRVVRGAARPLVEDGRVSREALEEEAMSQDELLAGLRKLGYESPARVRLATLEETGHISAVPFDDAPPSARGSDGPTAARQAGEPAS